MREGEDRLTPCMRPYELATRVTGWRRRGVPSLLRQNMEADPALGDLLEASRGPIRSRIQRYAARGVSIRPQVHWAVRLYPELAEELLLRAAQMNLSCSALVRAAVSLLLEHLRSELGPAPVVEGLTKWVDREKLGKNGDFGKT